MLLLQSNVASSADNSRRPVVEINKRHRSTSYGFFGGNLATLVDVFDDVAYFYICSQHPSIGVAQLTADHFHIIPVKCLFFLKKKIGIKQSHRRKLKVFVSTG